MIVAFHLLRVCIPNDCGHHPFKDAVLGGLPLGAVIKVVRVIQRAAKVRVGPHERRGGGGRVILLDGVGRDEAGWGRVEQGERLRLAMATNTPGQRDRISPPCFG